MATLRFPAFATVLVLLVATCGKGKAGAPDQAPAAAQGQAQAPGAPATAGLPAETRVVIGISVPKVAGSPLGRRLAAELLGRDAEAQQQLVELLARCKINAEKDLDTITIGMAEGQDIALVVRGKLDEPALVSCVKSETKANGGSFADKTMSGHTVYAATSKGGGQKVWFTFEPDRSAIVALSEAWLGKMIDPATPRIDGSKDIGKLLGRVSRDAAVWGTGLVPATVGQNIVKLTEGQVTQPAQSVAFEATFDKGLGALLRIDMASDTDAAKLATFAKGQLDFLAVAAQRFSIGPMVSKIQIVSEQASVKLSANLDDADVKALENALAKAAAPSKNPPAEKTGNKEQSR